MSIDLKPIGMRNIKTAIAVFICVLISKILNLEYPFYAVIAAIITMQNSVSGTFIAAKHRLMGTLVGAFVGVVCAWIAPADATLSAIGVIVLIYICNSLEWEDSISIAGIVFIAIMINLKDNTPVFYAVNRIVDTFMGITVAALVNYYILPPKITHRLEKASANIVNIIFPLVRTAITSPEGLDFTQFHKNILAFEKHITVLKKERKLRKTDQKDIDESIKLLGISNSIYIHISAIKLMKCNFSLNETNNKNFSRIFSEINHNTNVYKIEFANEKSLVYNYHIGEALELLEQLNRKDSKELCL